MSNTFPNTHLGKVTVKRCFLSADFPYLQRTIKELSSLQDRFLFLCSACSLDLAFLDKQDINNLHIKFMQHLVVKNFLNVVKLVSF